MTTQTDVGTAARRSQKRGRAADKPAAAVERIRIEKPKWPETGPAVAVSYSGGGYRASLAGIGVTRGLADLGLLGNVRYTSSVSGGSWANGLLAVNWEELKKRNFTTAAVDDLIVRPFVDRITTTSLSRRMMLGMWRVAGRRTRTDLLADAFDDWFGKGRTLGELSPDCRFIFNATNLSTGVRFGFEQQRVGDYKAWYIRGTGIRVADALAASAALPGALSAQRMPNPYNLFVGDRPLLVDGAVYDNLGVEPFQQIREKPLMVVLDAGAVMRTGIRARLGLMGTLKRSSAIIQSQVTMVRKRWFIDRLRAWEEWEESDPEGYHTYVSDQPAADELVKDWFRRLRNGQTEQGESPPPMPPPRSRRGVTFGIGTSLDIKDRDIEALLSRHQRYSPDPLAPELPEWRRDVTDIAGWRAQVADTPMSAGKFEPLLCRDLIYRGWWLTRESIRTFHPDALPADPPGWVEWYDSSS